MTERRRVKDLKPGDCAFIKGEWRTIRDVSVMTTLAFQPTSTCYVVWDPGDRRSNTQVPGNTFVEIREPQCRHGRTEATVSCRCNEYVACCSVDMDEHACATMNVTDGKHHG